MHFVDFYYSDFDFTLKIFRFKFLVIGYRFNYFQVSGMYKLKSINNSNIPLFKYIVDGSKKIEGRIASDYVRGFKVGEELLLQGLGEFVVVRINYLNFYKSFEEMLNAEGFENMIPFAKSFDEALKVYNGFPGSERVKSDGCCAIGIKYLRGELLN